jgi:uncharacterized spore protein YtfJ
MNDDVAKILDSDQKNHERLQSVMQQLIATANSTASFGSPVTANGFTVITASEVTVGLGYGFGLGGSVGEATEATPPGVGGGGGGGGGSMARPVAVISIGENGVNVSPIVDISKLGIAFFTALGTMWMMLARMKKYRSRRVQ